MKAGKAAGVEKGNKNLHPSPTFPGLPASFTFVPLGTRIEGEWPEGVPYA
jgi:hypothetical protein